MAISISVPQACAPWVLSGPAGAEIDTLAASLACGTLTPSVECVTPGTAYRISHSAKNMEKLAADLKAAGSGVTVALEQALEDVIRFDVRGNPTRYARTVHVNGKAAVRHVARAIDAGLIVTGAGPARWSVSGGSVSLGRWYRAAVPAAADDPTWAEIVLAREEVTTVYMTFAASAREPEAPAHFLDRKPSPATRRAAPRR